MERKKCRESLTGMNLTYMFGLAVARTEFDRRGNADNTYFNTLLNTLKLVKIHAGHTKSCGSHINLVGSM
jgi:hypothetical protein